MSFRIFSLTVICCALTGCQVATPRLVDMRPEWLQHLQIQRFDPYPDNDIAPEIVGGRPPGFGTQVNEVNRSRWVLADPGQRLFIPRGSAPAGATVPTGVVPPLNAPVIAPPIAIPELPRY